MGGPSKELSPDLVTQGMMEGTEPNITNGALTPKEFDLIMGVWLPGIICVLGILGNSISLLVLSSDRSNSTSFLTLKALALSDIALLFSALWQQVIPVYSYLIGCSNVFCRNIGYIRVYTWPIICIAQMNSIWLTVLISAERYTAICTPLQSKKGRNIPRIRLAIGGVLFASVAFNIPKFFEFQTVNHFDPAWNLTFVVIGDTDLRLHEVYRYAYNTALYGLVIFAMPLMILAMLNVSIVKDMREAQRRWDSLNRIQQRELKATTIPLCIVFVFLVCGTMAFTAFVLDAIFVSVTHLLLQVFTAIVNLFVVLNSAINFLIFYMFGSKFRKLCRRVLLCQGAWNTNGSTIHGSPILVRQFRRPRMEQISLETSGCEGRFNEMSRLRPPINQDERSSFTDGIPTSVILKDVSKEPLPYSL